MSIDSASPHHVNGKVWSFVVLAVSVVIALVSAHRYAGSWNDGSRLATVECLVDYHTLAIDRSIYVCVTPGSPTYPADDPGLVLFGTGDKLLIHGHFYSDKSPVPALLMAGFYQVLQSLTGLRARESPDGFAYLMTLGTSGFAYVAAIWCIYQMTGILSLALMPRLALTASLGFSTVALPYARHVNNHIVLLGILAALLLGLVRLAQEARERQAGCWQLLNLGTLAGLAYTVDLGAGPVILLCTLGLLAFRCRDRGRIALFLLAALPWLVLHHAVNFAVGGTWKPANAVAAYLQWPGSSFTSQNMTGSWNHQSIGQFLIYAAALLVGKRGFLGHNLPLFLALPALLILLLRRGNRERTEEGTPADSLPELLYAGCCWGGIWLIYALTSNNYSGQCCSIRWFVPLLAPGYYVLAVFLRQDPRPTWILLVLSGWGAVLAGIMWYVGPWTRNMVPLFWPVQGAACFSWLLLWMWRRRREGAVLRSGGWKLPSAA